MHSFKGFVEDEQDEESQEAKALEATSNLLQGQHTNVHSHQIAYVIDEATTRLNQVRE